MVKNYRDHYLKAAGLGTLKAVLEGRMTPRQAEGYRQKMISLLSQPGLTLDANLDIRKIGNESKKLRNRRRGVQNYNTRLSSLRTDTSI